MNMKKTVIFLLLLVISFNFNGCGKKPAEIGESTSTPTAVATGDKKESGAPESGQQTSNGSENPATPVPPSSNKTVVKDEEAPKVYWATENKDSAGITYHLENCPAIKDKNPAEISWEMVKAIGFRQCPVCNPPQYEGYVD